jgi:hypothetical protein
MQISDDVAYNIMQDFRKRNITQEDRAKFIIQFLKDNKLTLKELANITGVPYKTLQRWKSFDPDYAFALKEQGYSKVDIHRIMNHQTSPSDMRINYTLKEVIKMLEKHKRPDKYNQETYSLLATAIDLITEIKQRLD